jgi:hypothetical protein
LSQVDWSSTDALKKSVKYRRTLIYVGEQSGGKTGAE